MQVVLTNRRSERRPAFGFRASDLFRISIFVFWILIVVAAFQFSVVLAGDNWPQFRGPNGDGISDAKGLPLTFGETENLRWKTPIHGKGWSSPVVWGKQIWMTTAPDDGKEMYAVCVDLGSGKIIHDKKLWDDVQPHEDIKINSFASPTPVVEDGRCYVHFGSYGTAAIDTKTGEKIWERRDLPCNHFRGPGSSPIVFGNLLILTFDGYEYNYLAALNKQTSENVWKRDRNIKYNSDNGDYHKAFSTPQVIEPIGRRRKLISPSAGATVAYDPETGDELWRMRSGGMNAATRPLFGNGLIYCTAPAGGWPLFAVRPGGSGDVSDTQVAWKFKQAVPSRPSPLLLGNLIFMVSDNGVASCIDAVTSTPIWQHRFGGDYSASPVCADGKIYFFDENGKSQVIEAGKEFKQLAENHLDSGCMASPAVVGKSLIVRTKTDLYQFEIAPEAERKN